MTIGFVEWRHYDELMKKDDLDIERKLETEYFVDPFMLQVAECLLVHRPDEGGFSCWENAIFERYMDPMGLTKKDFDSAEINHHFYPSLDFIFYFRTVVSGVLEVVIIPRRDRKFFFF